jgi:hypothetical protein
VMKCQGQKNKKAPSIVSHPSTRQWPRAHQSFETSGPLLSSGLGSVDKAMDLWSTKQF